MNAPLAWGDIRPFGDAHPDLCARLPLSHFGAYIAAFFGKALLQAACADMAFDLRAGAALRAPSRQIYCSSLQALTARQVTMEMLKTMSRVWI